MRNGASIYREAIKLRKESAMGEKQDRAIGFELGMIHNLIRRSLNQRFSENGLEDLGGVQGHVIGYI